MMLCFYEDYALFSRILKYVTKTIYIITLLFAYDEISLFLFDDLNMLREGWTGWIKKKNSLFFVWMREYFSSFHLFFYPWMFETQIEKGYHHCNPVEPCHCWICRTSCCHHWYGSRLPLCGVFRRRRLKLMEKNGAHPCWSCKSHWSLSQLVARRSRCVRCLSLRLHLGVRLARHVAAHRWGAAVGYAPAVILGCKRKEEEGAMAPPHWN